MLPAQHIPDEYPIQQIPDTPWWSENYALMGSDPATRKGLFFGAGRWHGDRSIWRELMLIALPDGRIIFAKGYGRNGTEKGPGGAFGRLEVLQPGRKLRLTYDGPVWQSTYDELFARGFREGATGRCKLDVTFESAAPIWNMKGDSPGAASVAGAIHVEQVGRINGVVEYADEVHPFNGGYSIRDHSRGPRDISHYKAHCWTSGYFAASDTAYYVYAMQLQDIPGLAMSNAAIVRAGRCYPATVVNIDLPKKLDDVKALVSLTLSSELGDMQVEVIELLTRFPTGMVRPYDTIIGSRAAQRCVAFTDGPTRVRWDENEGFGWSELGYAAEPL
jgi:hypothetical protein